VTCGLPRERGFSVNPRSEPAASAGHPPGYLKTRGGSPIEPICWRFFDGTALGPDADFGGVDLEDRRSVATPIQKTLRHSAGLYEGRLTIVFAIVVLSGMLEEHGA
jgi:hypothetical protein